MKRLSVRTRLGSAFLLVGVVSVAVAGLLIDRTVRKMVFEQVAERLRYEVTMTGQMAASALFAPLAPDDTSLQGPITELSNAVHTQLGVLTPDGVVVADSERKADSKPSTDRQAPEIVTTLQEGKGAAVRGDGAGRRLWVAERVVREGAVLGIARASVPMSIVDAQVNLVRHRVLWAALAALLLGSVMGLGLSLGISRPIRRLAATARRIGQGDLDVRSAEPPGDEIGELSKALSDMSVNLKQMVAQLDLRNADMRRVLDAIDEGLLVVDMTGALETERSARIDDWFDRPAAGTPLWDLFAGASLPLRAGWRMAWDQLAEDCLPIELSIDQLPKRIMDGSRTYDLSYAPFLLGEVCERVLVVIRDTTLVAETERKEAEQRDLLAILGRSMADRPGTLDFLKEMDALLEKVSVHAAPLETSRNVHTIKGSCAVQGVLSFATLCHEIECRIADVGAIDEASVKLLRGRWAAFRQNVDTFAGPRAGILVAENEFDQVLATLVGGAARVSVLERMASWTMTPVEKPLGLLAERAKSLAERLGKGQIVVRVDHDGTKLDRERWAPLWANLVHAVRNAVDHGLESPDERQQAGKTEGSVCLSAFHARGELIIQVVDNGRGIDWAALAEKLKSRGLPFETPTDLVDGLFVDGVSTAGRVSEVSGRGVGMSALRECVRALSGNIRVSSTSGHGTTVACHFPEAHGELTRRVAALGAIQPSIAPPAAGCEARL